VPAVATGPRVVVERLDDRAGGDGGVVAAADGYLFGDHVDSSVSAGLCHHNTEISFRVEGDDADGNVVLVAEPAASEEASLRLVGGGDAQFAAGGTAAGLAAGTVSGLQLNNCKNIHQEEHEKSARIGNTGSNLDLDTPTAESLLEALWPEVSDLSDRPTDSWPDEEDFDLLFPDLV
jgi:hypothetical protein